MLNRLTFLLFSLIFATSNSFASEVWESMKRISPECEELTGEALPLLQNTNSIYYQLPTKLGYPPLSSGTNGGSRGSLERQDHTGQIITLVQTQPGSGLFRYQIAGIMSSDGALDSVKITKLQSDVSSKQKEFSSKQVKDGLLQIVAMDVEGKDVTYSFDLQQVVLLNSEEHLATVEVQACGKDRLFVTKAGNDIYQFDKDIIPFNYAIDIGSEASSIEIRYRNKPLRRYPIP